MKKIILLILIIFFTGSYASFGQGYLMFAGGGSEANVSGWASPPYGWFVEKAGGDRIVVLSNDDTSQWLPNFLGSLGATEVLNLIITGNTQQEILDALDGAGGVFMKGGNQQNYVNAWNNTPVEDAIMSVFENGGVIGGTSAGAMVGGEFISTGGPVSSDNLRNPFNGSNSIESDFLGFLPNTVFDTHYFERGRIGRLLGIMGKINSDHEPEVLYGIGLDDQTAVLIEPDGSLTVNGTGGVHVFRTTSQTEITAQPNTELDIKNLEFHQLTNGFTINLHTGELLAIPDDATTIQPFDTPGPRANFNFRRSFWTGGYLQQTAAQDNPSDLWIVLGEEQATAGFETAWENTELIPFNPALVDDEAYINSLFNARRLFVNLSVANWKILQSSALFKELAQTTDIEIELYMRHINLIADGYVTNAGANEFVSYDGLMQTRAGSSFLPGFVMVDSTYISNAQFENRASATGWLMNTYGSHFGVNTSGINQMRISDGVLHAGQQLIPTVVFDARGGYTTARSPYNTSNSNNATRNSAAISHGLVHVLPTNGQVLLYQDLQTSVPSPGIERPSGTFVLEGNYPNPFNPSTFIRVYSEANQRVTIEVFDYIGRRVLNKPEIMIQVGSNSVALDLGSMSTGLYLVRVSNASHAEAVRVTLVK